MATVVFVIRFTLLLRTYCHLCDDMLRELQQFQADRGFAIRLVDIDKDESLCAQYDELAPVLFGSKNGGADKQICHYFLDRAALEAFFEE